MLKIRRYEKKPRYVTVWRTPAEPVETARQTAEREAAPAEKTARPGAAASGPAAQPQPEPQTEAWFAQRPARILNVFRAAAARDGTLPIGVYEAVTKAAPAVGALSPDTVRSGVQEVLLSPHPEAAGTLVQAGALDAFGLHRLTGCAHELVKAPHTAGARWAALVRLCGARMETVQRTLWMSEALCREMRGAALLEDEPKLAVTRAQLHAEGLRGPRGDRVWADLCEAVRRCPQLNRADRLEVLAKGLAKAYRF